MPQPQPPMHGPSEAEHLMLTSYDRFIDLLNTRPRRAMEKAQQTARLWGVLSGDAPEGVAHPRGR